MGSVRTSKSALGQSLAAISVAVFFYSCPIHAQDNESVSEADAVEEIVVTGSRIKRRNLVSTSPVTQVDAVELEFQGITRVEDLLNDLPQVIADQSAGTNNGSSGTATVDLRGLEPIRTLTLLNGRRLPAGSPANPAVDINQIPGTLIERIEVLTGGASATYGSDAISGVVNFITVDDFQGVQFDYQFSQYAHENSSYLAQFVEDAGYALPSGNVSDGDTHNISLMAGFNGPGGEGNLTAYVTYRDVESVTQSERDHSACALFGESNDFFCGGSSTIPDGRFTDFGLLTNPDCVMVPAPTPEDPNAMACNRVPAFDYQTGLPTGESDPDGNPILMPEPVLPWFGNTSGSGSMPWPGRFDLLVDPGTNTFVNRAGHPNAFYNFAPTNYFMRPDERITAGVFGHYPLGSSAEIYVELNYMDDKTVAQLAPSGSFFWPETINCDNPFLSQQQFDLVCAQYNLTPADSQVAFLGRRNAEGGSRRAELQHTQYRGVLGIRGDVGVTWSYDAFVNYGEVEHSELFDEDLSITRMIRAVEVIPDPVSGQPVCRSAADGTDPDCIPWNVFESGAVTQEALDYITQPIFFDGSTEQIQINAFMSGDLGDYGIVVPTADEGIKVVFGLEYRDDSLEYNPDEAAQSGDVAGFGTSLPPVSGDLSVGEFFMEAAVPLLQGMAAAELVSVDIAYRYSDYSTDKQTDTYKLAGEWMFNPSIRLRASFQRAVRIGNIHELFRPTADSGGNAKDTCEGLNPVSTFEQCQNTGVTAAQYGNIVEADFDFINARYGGNEDLDPEESDTVSFGFIINPEFLPGFTLSADYFDIDVSGAIAAPEGSFIFDQCIQTGNPRFCDAVHRDPATSLLWLGEGYIDLRDTNIGSIRTSGVDVNADYVFEIGRFGDLQFNLVGTYVDTWEWQELPGETPFDCLGIYAGGPCFRARPELSTNLRSTWITPWEASVSLLWRYMSDVDDASGEDFHLPSTSYIDVAGVWNVTEDVSVRLGMNNVFDEDPPLAPRGSGNTLPDAYDALGRYWFAGMTVRL
jgi:outer membrane receptor protein involved in Fe transport